VQWETNLLNKHR